MTTTTKPLVPIFAGTVIPVRVSEETQPTSSGGLTLHIDSERPGQTEATKDAIANLGGADMECSVVEVKDPKRSILVKLTRLVRTDGQVPFQCNHQDVFEPLGVAPMVSPRMGQLFPGNDRKGWGFITVEAPDGFDLAPSVSPKDELAFIFGASIFMQPQ